MLTVIIYPKSSQEFLDEYQVLFEQYVEDGDISFCFWDEHGTDPVSALPDLYKKLKGIDKWKALIAMPLAEEAIDNDFACTPENPFDYLVNQELDRSVNESSIPLVRLTQMLAGVPPFVPSYSTVMEADGSKEQLVTKRDQTDAEMQTEYARWQELEDRYTLTCERPDSIYIYKGRQDIQEIQPPCSDTETENRHESDSSLFWLRNKYPAKVRFITKTFPNPDHIRYHRELFQYWMAVLVIAMNEFPPGTLESYRLYEAEALIDHHQVQKFFSFYYNRMDSIKTSACRQIAELRENAVLRRDKEELPEYRKSIHVSFSPLVTNNCDIDTGTLGLFKDTFQSDVSWWRSESRRIVKIIKKLYFSMRKDVDRGSRETKLLSIVEEQEIYSLDEYQYEEMADDLAELEKEILKFNTYSLFPMREYFRNAQETEKNVVSLMICRMKLPEGFGILAVGLAITVLGFLPVFFEHSGNLKPMYLLLYISLVIIADVWLFCLFWFRSAIVEKIIGFVKSTKKILDNFDQTEKRFSHYLTSCCTYMRGKYILQYLSRKTQRISSDIYNLNQHVEFMETRMQQSQGWLHSFNMEVTEDIGTLEGEYFDFDIQPSLNRGYMLQERSDRLVYMDDGYRITVPFPYISGLRIYRIPVFESEFIREEGNV